MQKSRIILMRWISQRNQTTTLQLYLLVGIQAYFRLIAYMVKLFYQKELPIHFGAKDLSQGHSDAVRRVSGVKGAVQYTIPNENGVNLVRSGTLPELSTREKHTRECYVVLENGADANEVEQAIVTMPNYFSDYDTTVTFITEEELKRDHSAMPHGGFVIRSGKTGNGNNQVMEYSLKLESNPEFTSSVLVAYARAAYRLNQNGEYGAKTVFDVAPGLLSKKTAADLRKELL